jgi:hypothetical protein
MSLSEKRSKQFIATIDSGAVTATVSSGQLSDVGTIGTILSPVSVGAIAAIGTIGTIQAGLVTATVASGQLSDVGTIGTILSPVAVGQISSVSTIGTIQSGLVTGQQFFKQTNLVTASVITGSFSGTLVAQNLQDLVVDAVYGTVVTGSIISAVVGVEPQTGRQISTIVAGDWFAGTLLTGQRLVAAGPLGALVAVNIYVATAGTLNAGTVQAVSVTAEQSSGP